MPPGRPHDKPKARRPKPEHRSAPADTPSPAARFALLEIAEQFVGADGVPGEARLRLVRALPNRTSQAWQLVLSEPVRADRGRSVDA